LLPKQLRLLSAKEQEFGLKSRSVLEDNRLAFDLTEVVPYDPYHSEVLGFFETVFAMILDSLKGVTISAVNRRTELITTDWSRKLPPWKLNNKEYELSGWSGSALLRLSSILPFIFPKLILESFKNKFRNKFGLAFQPRIPKVISSLIVYLSCLIVSRKYVKANSRELFKYISLSREYAKKVFPDITNRPNYHAAFHHLNTESQFGALWLVNTSRHEAKLLFLKSVVPHSNKKRIEFDMLLKSNAFLAVNLLISEQKIPPIDIWSKSNQTLKYQAIDPTLAHQFKNFLEEKHHRQILDDEIYGTSKIEVLNSINETVVLQINRAYACLSKSHHSLVMLLHCMIHLAHFPW